MNSPELDIIIPVYNEGQNILATLDSIHSHVRTPCRVLICYDDEKDDTLPAVESYPHGRLDIKLVKNRASGALGAVLTGFVESNAPAAIMFPADDDYNAPRIDPMMAKFREGCEIVVASRFAPGGCMKGCPVLKAVLVRVSAFALYHFARVPTGDPSNGLRIFSRRVLDTIQIESTVGFAYSIELLVKAHRLGWRVGEVPALWFERRAGKSRFQVLKWVPQYLKWFAYAFATTYMLRGPQTVALKKTCHNQIHRET
jgi:dolichol-phosphate mannosyltransferase